MAYLPEFGHRIGARGPIELIGLEGSVSWGCLKISLDPRGDFTWLGSPGMGCWGDSREVVERDPWLDRQSRKGLPTAELGSVIGFFDGQRGSGPEFDLQTVVVGVSAP